MAKRLSVKHRKRTHDQATTYAAGEAPKMHKIAKQRKKKALTKKAFPMT